jgi:Uma2 family endonuclease
MSTEIRHEKPARTDVLRGVGWNDYLRYRNHPGNAHLRMSYLDGTLILVSPEYLHDLSGRRLGLVIDLVTEALQIPIQGSVTTTLRRKSVGRRKGTAKEPDQAFYFGANAIRMQKKKQIDLDVDSPPDLVIEVDHKADSSRALKLYQRLGVTELWRFQVKSQSLWFGKLTDQGYETIDRSLHLPGLTPDLVLFALNQINELGETAAKPWLREWARTLPDPTA